MPASPNLVASRERLPPPRTTRSGIWERPQLLRSTPSLRNHLSDRVVGILDGSLFAGDAKTAQPTNETVAFVNADTFTLRAVAPLLDYPSSAKNVDAPGNHKLLTIPISILVRISGRTQAVIAQINIGDAIASRVKYFHERRMASLSPQRVIAISRAHRLVPLAQHCRSSPVEETLRLFGDGRRRSCARVARGRRSVIHFGRRAKPLGEDRFQASGPDFVAWSGRVQAVHHHAFV